jgi:hypothetical protein
VTTITLDNDLAATLERLRRTRHASLAELGNDALHCGLCEMNALAIERRRYRTPPVHLATPRIANIDNICELNGSLKADWGWLRRARTGEISWRLRGGHPNLRSMASSAVRKNARLADRSRKPLWNPQAMELDQRKIAAAESRWRDQADASRRQRAANTGRLLKPAGD